MSLENENEYWYDYNHSDVYVCNWCDGWIPQSKCYACTNYNKLSVEEAIQRQILKVVRLPSSQYLSNKSTLVSGNNINGGVGKKHDSYERYLSKKKIGHLKQSTKTVSPIQGNKTRSLAINQKCSC